MLIKVTHGNIVKALTIRLINESLTLYSKSFIISGHKLLYRERIYFL